MATVADERRLLPTREAAALLGVCVETLHRAVQAGNVPATRLGPRGWLRFDPVDLAALRTDTLARPAAGEPGYALLVADDALAAGHITPVEHAELLRLDALLARTRRP